MWKFASKFLRVARGGRLALAGSACLAVGVHFSSHSHNHYVQTEGEESSAHEYKYIPLSADVIGKRKNDAFRTELLKVLNSNQVETDSEELKQRGKPWSSYHKIDAFPSTIIYPESTEDVSSIVKLCNKYKISIIPFGGGTSLEGQTLTPEGGVSIDFCRMKKILELNEQDLDVRVQAGLGYVDLNEQLKDKKLWFPLDPGPGATIGGMCACRCSGSTAVRYGSMRDNVLNLTAVLPDGSIIKTGSRARKSSAGYDLTRLMIGSEGTLAIITEATLKIYGIPKVSYAIRITFPSGIYAAAMTAKDTLNCGVTIGRCEMLDDTMVRIINDANPNNPLGPWPEHTTLLYELTGISPAAVEEQIAIVTSIAESHGGTTFYTATSEEETKQFWKFRKECLWSAMSQYPDREPMITDVCVPLTKLPALINETKQDIEKINLPCPIIAHAGDGNFHVLIFFKPDDPEEVRQAKHLATTMGEKAIALGGTCTGEHGIGVGKKELLRQEMGEGSMRLMEIIKTAIDPLNIMNPGKVLDVSVETCESGKCEH